jgi:dynein light intermediate chain 2
MVCHKALSFIITHWFKSIKVALEYLFARRSAATPNQPKDVAHIWELGGGSQLSALVSVPLTPRTVSRAVVTVVVDLSQPQNLAHALGLWLDLLRKRCDECVNALKQSDPSAAEAILAAAAARASSNSNSNGSGSSSEHPDKYIVKPFPVPLLIIGSKLDTLKDRDSQDKKLVCCLLRFVAHAHGASLLTVGTKDKASQGNLRSTLTGLLLPSSSGSSSSKAARKEMSYDKPLVVTPGSDSFDDIFKASSLPKGVDSAGFVGKRGVAEDWVKKWGRPLEEAFGPAKPSPEDLLEVSMEGQPFVEGEGEEKGGDAHASSADLYREPLVDEARALRE